MTSQFWDDPKADAKQDITNAIGALENAVFEPYFDLDPRPCLGRNSNVCVAEGCYDEACLRLPAVMPWVVPPVFRLDRLAALVDIHPFDNDLNPCVKQCAYGECSAPGSYRGCGGCCGCLHGCQVEYENQQIAPFLWEGDYA